MQNNNVVPRLLVIIALIWLIPDSVLASTDNSIASVLCKVVSYLHGPIGSVIAILGVISLGVIAMFGKIQISSMLTVMAGIGIIFGAPTILENIGISIYKINPQCGALTTDTLKEIVNSQFFTILACVAKWFVGAMGKALASLSIIVIGVFAVYGRISWHQAMVIAVGIAMMFGAVSIVTAMGVPVYGSNGKGGVVTGKFLFTDACSDGGLGLDIIFCNGIRIMTGSVGQGIATVGLTIIGIGALFGKVSWILTMVFATGVALIFGANNIIESLGVSDTISCVDDKTLTN
jgi:type IV secretory pathway VirB2 component (pilin)